MSEPNRRNGKRQYLVTYSQLNKDLFPSRQSFGNMIEREFSRGNSVVKVSHWACCQEAHQDGGQHYHCAVKLTGLKKWVRVKETIQEVYGISVNFSDSHDSYLSAYRYVTKTDVDVVHSEGHPNLADAKSPQTKAATAANKRRSTERASTGCKARKRLRLTNQDAAMFIRQHNIHDYIQFLAVADERLKEGLTDISDFIFNRSENTLRELIVKTWQMAGAAAKIEKKKKDRFDILVDYKFEKLCVCDGEWLSCAKEILRLNGIREEEFVGAIKLSLQHGRGKFRNVMIVGPTNCAKTFILKPLATMYSDEIFENPANHRFGWVGAERASVIMLQDFRWSQDLICWKDFLLLLEGEIVHLPAPRNVYKEDICISGDVAIFATGKSEITFRGPYNSTDNREDEMMKSRWRVFQFKHQFKEEDQKTVPPCGNCFAKFILP